MKRISKMLLLLTVISAPVALFVIDNQKIVKDSSDIVLPKPDPNKNVTYSSYTTAE
ncbi:hypothetical protein ABDK00_007325 [Niabella insulamsoli]|uniref:hypothetical protein n=1 Tax=Niabella insulamsoli TaxID=3144874 RepID=UPI0031FD4C54